MYKIWKSETRRNVFSSLGMFRISQDSTAEANDDNIEKSNLKTDLKTSGVLDVRSCHDLVVSACLKPLADIPYAIFIFR